MSRVVPLPTPDQPLLEQTVSLDGSSFTLTFDWSERNDTWAFQIEDAEGNTLTSGGILTYGVDLLRHIASENRPGGALFVLTTPEAVTPTLDNISEAYLLYFEESEFVRNGA